VSRGERQRRVQSSDASRTPPRWLLVLLLAMLFVMPWPLGANRDWIWPWFAAVAFALLALLLAGFAFGWWRPRWQTRSLHGFLLLCAAWSIYAVLAGGWLGVDFAPWDAAAARLGAMKALSYVAIAVLVAWLASSRSRLRAIAYVLFAAGVLQALYGAFMVLSGIEWGAFGPKLSNRGVATGTFVNRNHLAGCLALCGSLGVGLLVAQLADTHSVGWRQRLRSVVAMLLGPKTAVRVALAVLVIGLVMTQSRMGNIAFFVAMALAAVWALLRMRPLPRSLVWLFASLVAFDVLILGSWFGIERLAQRLSETRVLAVSGDASGGVSTVSTEEERILVAATALRLWQERPWVGVGPGGFRMAYPSVKPAEVQLFYEHAHNDWAQLLAEWGGIGTVLWSVLVGYALVAAARSVASPDGTVRGLALGCLMGIVALSLHGFADFNFQIPANASYFHGLLGLAVALRSHAQASGRMRRRASTGLNHASPSESAVDEAGSRAL
jgi:O-antigen ligase